MKINNGIWQDWAYDINIEAIEAQYRTKHLTIIIERKGADERHWYLTIPQLDIRKEILNSVYKEDAQKEALKSLNEYLDILKTELA